MPSRPGNPRKPHALKLADGDYIKDPQRRPKNPSTPKVSAPRCPTYIKGEGRREWKRICKELAELRVLSLAERSSLEQYCDAYAKWRDAIKQLAENGAYCFTEKGVVEHPAGKAHRAYAALCTKILCEFGLTPCSRTRLVITEGTDQDNVAAKYLG